MAFAGAHTAPHAPQSDSVVSEVSHPFTALPSQLPQPMSHPGEHAPATQCVTPCGFVHATPQPPQFEVVLSCVSQPFEATPSQLPQPLLHVMEQAPSAHDGVPFAELHTLPHVPQFETLVCTFVSQPLEAVPSQFPNPVVQDSIWHEPVEHVALAFASAHATPHPPQSASVVSDFSQPFAGFPSQLPHPVVHVGTQAPEVQTVVPWAFVHAAPQLPQFEVVFRVASQPLPTLPSQLP